MVSLRSLGLPKYRNFGFRTNDRIQIIKELGQESGCELPAAKSCVWHKTYECPEPTPCPYCGEPLRSPPSQAMPFLPSGLALGTGENSDFFAYCQWPFSLSRYSGAIVFPAFCARSTTVLALP